MFVRGVVDGVEFNGYDNVSPDFKYIVDPWLSVNISERNSRCQRF